MSVIQQGLLITAIGMGLVFAVIIFLWGLMALMMRFTSRTKPVKVEQISTTASPEQVPIPPTSQIFERGKRVIAAAVAVNLMLESEKLKSSQGEVQRLGQLSPWQAVHRTRQLEQKRTRG